MSSKTRSTWKTKAIVGLSTAGISLATLGIGSMTAWADHSAGDSHLSVNGGDVATVKPGDTVQVSGTCPNDGSALNYVGSEAFVKRSNDPYPGPGGSAEITKDDPLAFNGRATIGNVAPGDYQVSLRCEGPAASATLHVVQ